MKKLLGPALGLMLLGSACSSTNDTDETTRDESGTIVEGGDLGVFAINVGDCFDDTNFGTEIEQVDGASCAAEHMYEVYHAFDIPGDDFPGEDAIVAQAQDGCLGAFDGFVGIAYEDSILDISYLYPTEDSWNLGDDREVLCMVFNLDNTPRTGSARGAAV